MKLKVKCDFCGIEFEKYESRMTPHNFCSRKCLANFSNKNKNPKAYKSLKDYTKMSEHLSELNRELNPTRMIPETREKIRNARLDSREGVTYSKYYGRHTHRVVAEK
ncbi:TPA: hypothetical protein ACYSZF_001532 [Streptococcus suis]